MTTPTPLRSFFGGLGLPLPMHALVVLNGSVFGISGFIHRSVRGNVEALVGVAGLVAGGVVAGLVEGPPVQNYLPSLPQLLLSGFLAGLGSKMANGCTSGHMLAGIGRLSSRSLAATAAFFTTGMLTARIFHSNDPMFSSSPFDLDMTAEFGDSAKTLLALQLGPLLVSTIQYLTSSKPKTQTEPSPTSRKLAVFNSSVNFALALSLSNLVDNRKVISFLRLPSVDIDPSLAFLALGALPLSLALHAFFRREKDVPALGGPWSIPKAGAIDARLTCGAAIFGVGWAWSGICHGPALVNLGRSLAAGTGILPHAAWLAATLLGGLVV